MKTLKFKRLGEEYRSRAEFDVGEIVTWQHKRRVKRGAIVSRWWDGYEYRYAITTDGRQTVSSIYWSIPESKLAPTNRRQKALYLRQVVRG